MPIILKLLLYGSYFSVLIPMYYYFKKKSDFSRNQVLNRLVLLLFINALFDLLGYLAIKLDGSNILLSNIYFIFQFCAVSYIYISLFKKNKLLVYMGLMVFTAVVFINALYITPFTEFQNWPRFIGNIILVSYSIVFYLEMYNNLPTDEQYSSLVLWVNMAVLFYFGMNLYLFATFDYILKNESDEIAIMSWSFHNVCNIVKNGLFAIGIYYAGIRQIKMG